MPVRINISQSALSAIFAEIFKPNPEESTPRRRWPFDPGGPRSFDWHERISLQGQEVAQSVIREVRSMGRMSKFMASQKDVKISHDFLRQEVAKYLMEICPPYRKFPPRKGPINPLDVLPLLIASSILQMQALDKGEYQDIYQFAADEGFAHAAKALDSIDI